MTRSEAETADFRSHLREKAYVGVRWIIVQSGIHDRFLERLVAAVEGLQVGNGLEAGSSRDR